MSAGRPVPLLEVCKGTCLHVLVQYLAAMRMQYITVCRSQLDSQFSIALPCHGSVVCQLCRCGLGVVFLLEYVPRPIAGTAANRLYFSMPQFPYCDGAHAVHNKETGDNVGPLIIDNDVKQ